MQTVSWLNVFHVSPVFIDITHPYNLLVFPDFHLTKEHCVCNLILIMPHCQVALVNILAIPLLLLRLRYRSLAEVLLFVLEFTNDLDHVYIHVAEENLYGGPLGCISMDTAVAAHHVPTDLWNCAAKQCKNGKVTFYDTASTLERVQYFSDQGSIISIFVSLCVAALFRIIQVIPGSNILVDVRLLG